ncbi:MAG: IS110 family transposase [Actinomycetota bacterium]|nr:IS110 family transposase [Actinomycetota bacterium]
MAIDEPAQASSSQPADDIGIGVAGSEDVTAAAILGRLGGPNRFRSLAGVRSFSGLVPSLDASGVAGAHGGPTKRGDAVLREALFLAADHARRQDPTLAARYHRLMTVAGKHHNSALCHIAMTLLTRIVTCWRNGEPYQLRDVDGRPVTPEEARSIIAERYQISDELRRRRRVVTHAKRMKQGRAGRRKESPSAPSAGPRPRQGRSANPSLTAIRNSTVPATALATSGPS